MSVRAAAVLLLACVGACHAAEPAVTAPVATVDVASAAPAPPAVDAAAPEPPPAEPDEADDHELPPHEDPNAPPPATPSDPCSGRCTGNDICRVYEHRPPRKAAPPSPPDASFLARFPFDEDAGAFRSEIHCLPQSARCPAGTHTSTSRMMLTNGVMTRWYTCTLFHGP